MIYIAVTTSTVRSAAVFHKKTILTSYLVYVPPDYGTIYQRNEQK